MNNEPVVHMFIQEKFCDTFAAVLYLAFQLWGVDKPQEPE